MFRVLNEAERAAVRCYLADPDQSGLTWSAVQKLMQNYQDTATELAEHEATLEARMPRDWRDL